MFSKKCEYAMKASIFIAKESLAQKRTNLKAIASTIGSPVVFTAKILQDMVKANIIISIRGAAGGFEMTPQQLKTMTLATIVRSIDGDEIFNHCVLGLDHCTDNDPCPVHISYKSIRNATNKMLEETLIQSLARDVEQHAGTLKN